VENLEKTNKTKSTNFGHTPQKSAQYTLKIKQAQTQFKNYLKKQKPKCLVWSNVAIL
jgi:hypothetical protein